MGRKRKEEKQQPEEQREQNEVQIVKDVTQTIENLPTLEELEEVLRQVAYGVYALRQHVKDMKGQLQTFTPRYLISVYYGEKISTVSMEYQAVKALVTKIPPMIVKALSDVDNLYTFFSLYGYPGPETMSRLSNIHRGLVEQTFILSAVLLEMSDTLLWEIFVSSAPEIDKALSEFGKMNQLALTIPSN